MGGDLSAGLGAALGPAGGGLSNSSSASSELNTGDSFTGNRDIGIRGPTFGLTFPSLKDLSTTHLAVGAGVALLGLIIWKRA